jgi:glutamate synthase (NADPH/NADH) small chain
MPARIRYEDRNPEPLLAPQERVKTFREYALGYSVSLALDEANRCLLCKDADQRCIKACPAGIDIPGFIKKLSEGDLFGALQGLSCSLIPFPLCVVGCALRRSSVRALAYCITTR